MTDDEEYMKGIEKKKEVYEKMGVAVVWYFVRTGRQNRLLTRLAAVDRAMLTFSTSGIEDSS